MTGAVVLALNRRRRAAALTFLTGEIDGTNLEANNIIVSAQITACLIDSVRGTKQTVGRLLPLVGRKDSFAAVVDINTVKRRPAHYKNNLDAQT